MSQPNPFAAAAVVVFGGPMGSDARFKGALCRVIVSAGLKVVGEYGENAGLITQVDFLASAGAQQGDMVEIGALADDGTFTPAQVYRLDAVVEDDGITRGFAVIPA